MTKTIKSLRSKAFRQQNGYCYYCEQPMWLSESDAIQLARRHCLRLSQVNPLKCTAEHLRARQDGGADEADNIVAACWFCNNHRHRQVNPMKPPAYRNLVQQRLAHGRWHRLAIRDRVSK